MPKQQNKMERNAMDTIVCPECHEEILIVPNLKRMSEAIERHVDKHRKDTPENTLLCTKIHSSLTQQILIAVARK